MEIRQCILKDNDCYKAGRYISPKGIMIHSTGADNPKLKRYLAPDDGYIGQNDYGNDWNRSGVGVCVHGFIGKDKDGAVRIYQTLPWNMRGWHCGASGNDTHISFEICEDALTDRGYFEAARDAALELCAYLCREFALDPQERGVIVDHAEGFDLGIASGHSDVGHWWKRFGYTMEDFRRDLQNRLKPRGDGLYHSPEQIPGWAKGAVLPMIERGILRGDETGDLKLTEDLLRTLVILSRLMEEKSESTV